MFGSEGGIDGSNLPYSFVSLPLSNAESVATNINRQIKLALNKRISVIIVDTDKTYSLGNFHFTPRLRPLKGIHSLGGFAAYLIGRMLKLRKRATPMAINGKQIAIEEVLRISDIANRSRGFGAGRTVWDMASKFKVGLTSVSWEMLETVKHKPIVILRKTW